jgi:protoheme IX farnesyltransferase
MIEDFGNYLELTKPKVTLLNLLVGLTCFLLARFPAVDWTKCLVFLFAGYLVAGGSGALNSVYDQEVDKLMLRTSKRVIPSGKITIRQATAFGTVITVAGLSIAFFFLNSWTALLMILGIMFYLPIYTVMLKRHYTWNVIVGGLAGCFAALSGWTATGQILTLTPLLVAAVDFLWTPGHLWALAIQKNNEYKSAGIPMLPAIFGLKQASQTVFAFNLATIGVSFLLPIVGLTGVLYVGFALVAGAGLFIESKKLLFSQDGKQGFRVFLISLPYLSAIMVGLLLDANFSRMPLIVLRF